ncbi:MAG: ABC transporter permease [Anaerolineae bacterium]|nr:ABC transporter permease [Anaerolineae bacterium]
MATTGPLKSIIPSRRLRRGIALLPFSLAAGIFLWYLVIWAGDLQAFILPPPDLVWQRFLRALGDGSLSRHFRITLGEVLGGLALGGVSATALGYLLARSRPLERLLAPYIVASQSVPIVAIAPLLVIWFGPGIASKMLICALIVFFPILINTIVGVRSVPEDLYDLMRTLQASRWQTFKKLEIPAALPVLFGGLRIGATLAVIGAVVGEFVGSDRGLGFLINLGRGQFDTALVFVAVFSLVAMALSLYIIVNFIENHLLLWQVRPEQDEKSNL